MVSAVRQQAIDNAFALFVKSDPNSIDAVDVRRGYQTHLHPRVISGELSNDEVLLEFLTNFSDRNRDGRIHKDEWDAHYAKVSANVSNDAHFVTLMSQTWKL